MKAYIDIKKWGKVRDLLGVKVMEVRMGEGAETILVVDGPREALDTLFNKKARRTPVEELKGRKSASKQKLAVILAEMVNKAESRPGSPQRYELRGGMRIDIMKGIDGVLRMQISRLKVWPSEVEWETTVKNLPDGMGSGKMVKMEHLGRCFLRGELR